MSWENITNREDRGITPVVAVILLVGLVAMTATVTMIAGMSLMETIETQTEVEQTQQSFDVTSEQFRQAVLTGDPQGISKTADSSELKTGTTTIAFKRANVDFDDPEYDSEWEAEDQYEVDINAIEYHVDGSDQRFVFEGGGQWRVSDDHVSIQSAPQFRFSYDETPGLDVSLTNIDESSQLSGSNLVARSDGPGSNTIDEDELLDILAYDESDPSGEDIVIEIETEYYDAWEEALDRHSNLDHEHVQYYHDRENGVLRVAIEQLAIEHSATFNIDSIDTVTENVEHGDTLEVDVTVENTGAVEGSTDVDMTIAGQAPVTHSTNDLDPGEFQTLTFEYASDPGGGGADGSLVDVDAISNQKHQNVDQYDEYKFEIETDDDHGTGSFLFSQPEAFLRIEDHSYDPSSGVVTADLTNIAGSEHEYDITFALEGESDDGEVDISEERTLEDVSQRSWEESTYEMNINQTRLPYGEYEYTVDVSDTNFPAAHNNNSDASIASGTFELNAGDGVGTEPGEIVVEEPTDVSVNLIGTEISAERVHPENYGVYQKDWAPVTASAVVGDERYRFMPDGSTEQIPLDQPHYTPDGTDIGDFDLNTYDTQDRIYEFDDAIEEGSVTIEATYWRCEDGAYSNIVATDSGLWHYDCAGGDLTAPTTIDVAGDDAAVDSGFLMTRDQERNDLPDIEKGYPLQRSLQEVFDDGAGVDIEDDELQLGAQDFAFMMEVTMDQDGLADEYDWGGGYDGEYADAFDSDDQTQANLAAWDIAKDYRDSSRFATNDPNFNDVIGYVEIDPGESYVENENPLHNDPTIDGDQRSVDTETSDVTGGGDDGSGNVDVGVDEIVIS